MREIALFLLHFFSKQERSILLLTVRLINPFPKEALVFTCLQHKSSLPFWPTFHHFQQNLNKSFKLSQDTTVPLPLVAGGNRKGQVEEESRAAEIRYMIEIGMNELHNMQEISIPFFNSFLLNSLANDKILDWFKLKVFADDKLYVA